MKDYKKMVEVTDDYRDKFRDAAEYVVNTQYTEIPGQKPFSKEDHEIFVYDVAETMAYGSNIEKNDNLVTELALIGISALLGFALCKFINRNKKEKV